ncbi:ATP-binding cassette domain-containing protein [Paroceanicella profunda]|uniref:ATP-binding cassette domain-containing protein n=1 Tax=Paroceanicella profunda TaxID=2579971 RepID=A0A5B8G079_9RHOB|nr:ATP-binding cassette domain-containing protein [Paroceanicella profunda]QDL91893.1 ATP-binding cassette domain-containing protein [Paroceanicella profunda]
MADPAALTLEGAGLVLSGRRVLQDITLAVHPGELLALCGPNGAGKSSLLSLLAGDRRPDTGAARLSGAPVTSLSPARLARARAVLEQAPASALPFTVEALAGLGIPREIAPAEARRLVSGVLADTRLEARARVPLSRLSGGQQLRAHLARTLAQLRAGRLLGGGHWLLLDEPTASLDIAQQIVTMRLAAAEARAGAGVVAVLHDLNLAAAFADRIGLMEAGRLVALGPPRTVCTPSRLGQLYATEVRVETGPDGTLRILPSYGAPPTPVPGQAPR